MVEFRGRTAIRSSERRRAEERVPLNKVKNRTLERHKHAAPGARREILSLCVHASLASGSPRSWVSGMTRGSAHFMTKVRHGSEGRFGCRWTGSSRSEERFKIRTL